MDYKIKLVCEAKWSFTAIFKSTMGWNPWVRLKSKITLSCGSCQCLIFYIHPPPIWVMSTQKLFQRDAVQIHKDWIIFFICWFDDPFCSHSVKCTRIYVLDIIVWKLSYCLGLRINYNWKRKQNKRWSRKNYTGTCFKFNCFNSDSFVW